MSGYTISIKNSTLYVSDSDIKGEIYKKKLDEDIASGSEILQPDLLAEELGTSLLELFESELKRKPLNFLVEPQDIIVGFLHENKNIENIDNYLLGSAKKHLAKTGLTVEDVYFSYQKISPFVYQFVAIKKDKLESYLTISNALNYELGVILPWILLFPKFLGNAIKKTAYIYKVEDKVNVAYFELNGLYKVEDFEDKSTFESKNVKKIYIDSNLDLELEDAEKVDFENPHQLFEDTMDDKYKTTQLNLLNLLPLPSKKDSLSPLVYVGSTVAALIIFVGIFFGPDLVKNITNKDEIDVLGGSEQLFEESEQEYEQENLVIVGDNVDEQKEEDKEVEKMENEVDLKKEYLTIRIENATQISGLAGRTKTHLAKFGYDISSIGDSEESGRVTTLVQFTPDFIVYKDMLLEDLGEMYDQIEVKGELEEDLGYDVLITVGTDEE